MCFFDRVPLSCVVIPESPATEVSQRKVPLLHSFFFSQDLLRSLTVVFTRLRSRGYGEKSHINRIHWNSLLPTSLRSAPHCFFFHFTSFVCFETVVDEHGFNALLSWSKLKAFSPLVSYKTFASASWTVTTIDIGIF